METSELQQLIRRSETCDFFFFQKNIQWAVFFPQRDLENKINNYVSMNTSEVWDLNSATGQRLWKS